MDNETEKMKRSTHLHKIEKLEQSHYNQASSTLINQLFFLITLMKRRIQSQLTAHSVSNPSNTMVIVGGVGMTLFIHVHVLVREQLVLKSTIRHYKECSFLSTVSDIRQNFISKFWDF